MVLGLVGAWQGWLLVLLVITAMLAPAILSPTFARLERFFSSIGEARNLHLAIVFLLAVGLRAALLPLLPAPPLLIPDEFSLLFQAELMLQGRWAAPFDPMWQHLEEMHLIVTPVRAAIYFPGRSLPLLLGLIIAGSPWVGTLLTTAALAAAVTWMLQAWVRPLSALLGGVIVVLQFGLFSYWVNGYWGGSVTALGAALTLGAAGRLQAGARWRHGIWAAFGVFLMMTSRPFEGLLFCAGIGLVLLPWALRAIASKQTSAVAKFALPVLAAVVMGGGVLASHSAAITGDPLKPAYEVGRVQYGGAPPFLMSAPLLRTTWPDAQLTKLYRWEIPPYERRASIPTLFEALVQKSLLLFAFFVGPAMLIPCVVGFFSLGYRGAMPALAGGFVSIGFMVTTWDFPHYAAPLLPCVLLFVVAGLEKLRGLSFRGQPSGLFLARTLPLLLLLGVALPVAYLATGWPAGISNFWDRSCCAVVRTTEREAVERSLEATRGDDLVFVRYDEHSGRHAWVYNAPDLQSAPIIWARDLGDERNSRLIARFPDRRVWVVQPRNWVVQPRPYHPFQGD